MFEISREDHPSTQHQVTIETIPDPDEPTIIENIAGPSGGHAYQNQARIPRHTYPYPQPPPPKPQPENTVQYHTLIGENIPISGVRRNIGDLGAFMVSPASS